MNKKKVLIVGENSYIGTNIENWLTHKNNKYIIETVSSRDNNWNMINFSEFDTIIHVAGIAHVSKKAKLKELYYKINRDLAIDVANKAKQEKARQFIFLSSMIIYGKDEPIGEEKEIDKNTIPNPEDFYGKSKLEADTYIQTLESEEFKTVIIRTPMVYGPNCKGNFPKLKKIAKLSPIFPDIDNKRSIIYIDNLCEFIKQAIDNNISGIFYPQNKEYVGTKDIVKTIRDINGKKTHFIKLFNPLIKLMSKKIGFINKVFGSKTYKKILSGDYSYCVVSFKESIEKCNNAK